MNPEENERLNHDAKPENRPALWVRWIPVFSVVFVLIVIAIISHAGKVNSNSETASGEVADEAASGIGEKSDESGTVRYIEDVGGPHDFIEGRESANCRGCHLPQYDDWHSSPHGEALASDAFGATFRLVEQTISMRGCIACHGPQTLDFAAGDVELVDPPDQGISCISCHSKESRVGLYILEEEREIEYTDSRSPEFCASCHDPEEALISVIAPVIASQFGIAEPMGNPYEEWRQSRYSPDGSGYITCIECHGQGGTGTLHSWPEDVATMLKAAYTIEKLPATNTNGEMSIGIRVTNTGAGHNLPTGDPGRLLVFDLKIVNVENPDVILEEMSFNLGVYVEGDGNLVVNSLTPGSSIEFLAGISSDITMPPGSLDVRYTVSYTYDSVFAEFLSGLGIEVETILVDEG